MRHVYHCHLRWADLDSLGHINNVVYVDYLQEARVSLMRAVVGDRRDDLAEGVVVVRHEVTYLAPLGFRFEPVSIECWVTEIRAATFTMAYEVFSEQEDGIRTVYLRATTVLTPYVFAHERPRRLSEEEKAALAPYVEAAPGPATTPIAALERGAAHRFPLYVRFSDVDIYRHVNNVKYFEYLQEARVRQMAALTQGSGFTGLAFVTAQTDVDYRRPILLRHEPYDVWSAIIAVGNRSMTIESEIADAGQVLARARVTVVFFDPETQRSAEPPPEVRALLLSAVVSAPDGC
ncbi:MAG: thioesterase family protein [Nocardioides sp.]